MLFLQYKAWNILYLLNEFLVNSLIYCIRQKSLVSARRGFKLRDHIIRVHEALALNFDNNFSKYSQ